MARTTPEAIDLQEDLRAMLDGGDSACAMEVSSHALELGRVDAIAFAAAIFTNLTQDHLDFHASMDDYFNAKRRLFVGRRQRLGRTGAGRERGQRRGSVRPAPGGRAGGRADVRGGSAGGLQRNRPALWAGRLRLHAPDARGPADGVAADAGALQRCQRARRAGGGARARGRLDVLVARAGARACTCPGASSRSTPASPSRCWSTTRTRRTRSRTCCARRAIWSR